MHRPKSLHGGLKRPNIHKLSSYSNQISKGLARPQSVCLTHSNKLFTWVLDFFAFNLAPFGAFLPCLGPTHIDYLLWVWNHHPIFLFSNQPHLGHFLRPAGLFLGLESGSNNLFKPTHIGYTLWFWMYSPIFLFLILPHLGFSGSFLGPEGPFLGFQSGSKTFFGICLNID